MWRSKERCTNVRVFINVYHWSRFCALLQDMNLMIHTHEEPSKILNEGSSRSSNYLDNIHLVLISVLPFPLFFLANTHAIFKIHNQFCFSGVFFLFSSWCVLAKQLVTRTTRWNNVSLFEPIITEKFAKKTVFSHSLRISLFLFLSHVRLQTTSVK